MTNEKWEELVELAKKNFKDTKLDREELITETSDGPMRQGTQDILDFFHPNGDHFRLIRENRPVVLEKKEIFSHRAGQSAQTQYKFSETEFSHKIKVFKETGFDEWNEITLDSLGL